MRHFAGILLGLFVAAILLTATSPAAAQKKRGRRPAKRPVAKPKAPKLPPLKTAADKRKFLEAIRSQFPVRKTGRSVVYGSADLDYALQARIGLPEDRFAPIIGDEKFVRRVYLDLTGKLPPAFVVRKFVANGDSAKRSKLIDQLLESKAYARKWAQYWTDVVFYDSAANKRRVNRKALEDWFATQFEKNVPWDKIVAELVSAYPVRNKKEKNDWGQDYGPNNFVLAAESKAEQVASQTARIFMGISIQCAECHNHPFDQWKRSQFHELAAFFSRGKYYMTDQYDPSKKKEMQPRFLLGETPPIKLTPHQRRVAVAAYLVYNQGNHWFARAFVNRVWNELLGDGFYAVDALGPDGEAVHVSIVNRLGAVFRYRGFDPKWVLRTIMNTRTYQRDVRPIEDDARLFTAVRPSRMRPEQVVAAVQKITGPQKNITRQVAATFKINPSIPQRDLEGSIQQALLLMNNRTIQSRLRNGDLKKKLVGIRSNPAMLDELYLNVLARRPTGKERVRAVQYIQTSGNRPEAIEDLIWVLMNSTEFVTKR